MSKVLTFPQQPQAQVADPFDLAVQAIESRLGVSFLDYLGTNGKRTAEVQNQIDKALKKETFLIPCDSI